MGINLQSALLAALATAACAVPPPSTKNPGDSATAETTTLNCQIVVEPVFGQPPIEPRQALLFIDGSTAEDLILTLRGTFRGTVETTATSYTIRFKAPHPGVLDDEELVLRINRYTHEGMREMFNVKTGKSVVLDDLYCEPYARKPL